MSDIHDAEEIGMRNLATLVREIAHQTGNDGEEEYREFVAHLLNHLLPSLSVTMMIEIDSFVDETVIAVARFWTPSNIAPKNVADLMQAQVDQWRETNVS